MKQAIAIVLGALFIFVVWALKGESDQETFDQWARLVNMRATIQALTECDPVYNMINGTEAMKLGACHACMEYKINEATLKILKSDELHK